MFPKFIEQHNERHNEIFDSMMVEFYLSWSLPRSTYSILTILFIFHIKVRKKYQKKITLNSLLHF